MLLELNTCNEQHHTAKKTKVPTRLYVKIMLTLNKTCNDRTLWKRMCKHSGIAVSSMSCGLKLFRKEEVLKCVRLRLRLKSDVATVLGEFAVLSKDRWGSTNCVEVRPDF